MSTSETGQIYILCCFPFPCDASFFPFYFLRSRWQFSFLLLFLFRRKPTNRSSGGGDQWLFTSERRWLAAGHQVGNLSCLLFLLISVIWFVGRPSNFSFLLCIEFLALISPLSFNVSSDVDRRLSSLSFSKGKKNRLPVGLSRPEAAV